MRSSRRAAAAVPGRASVARVTGDERRQPRGGSSGEWAPAGARAHGRRGAEVGGTLMPFLFFFYKRLKPSGLLIFFLL